LLPYLGGGCFLSSKLLPSSLSRADFGLFKGTKPMRKRTGRGRIVSYSGIFASTKCLGPADFESLLERDFQTLLCADPRVQAYAVQAHQLTYFTPGTQRTFIPRLYTPDIVVQLRDGRIMVIEVKAEFLAAQTQWQEREPYIREAYARDYAIQFVVVTERQIRIQPKLSNCESMLRYGARSSDPVAHLAICDVLGETQGDLRVGEVCGSANIADNRMSRAYSALLRMALTGEIELDLNQPLSLSTPIVKRASNA
jgi:hypothetical protein